MRKVLEITERRPQYATCKNLTFSQVDYWFGHTVKDLQMDVIYPEDKTKKYPCVVWICGGGWMTFDRGAHMAYLSKLALSGFVVASIDYRTSNESKFPAALIDVKSAIRYLKANAERFNIDPDRIGVSGESAGGFLSCAAAILTDKSFDKGAYLEYSSLVKAACPWYPPTHLDSFPKPEGAARYLSPEVAFFGLEILENKEEADKLSFINKLSKETVPFMIIHGNNDHTVPFQQGELLYEELTKVGADASLVEISGADHADIQFFQDDVWDLIIEFFKNKL